MKELIITLLGVAAAVLGYMRFCVWLNQQPIEPQSDDPNDLGD